MRLTLLQAALKNEQQHYIRELILSPRQAYKTGRRIKKLASRIQKRVRIWNFAMDAEINNGLEKMK